MMTLLSFLLYVIWGFTLLGNFFFKFLSIDLTSFILVFFSLLLYFGMKCYVIFASHFCSEALQGQLCDSPYCCYNFFWCCFIYFGEYFFNNIFSGIVLLEETLFLVAYVLLLNRYLLNRQDKHIVPVFSMYHFSN